MSCNLEIMTTTPYIPVRVDTRGSLNLPADIKSRLGVMPGVTLLSRQINGVIILVPFTGEAEVAFQEDRLHTWVGQQLSAPITPMPLHTASKMATAEAIRLQASRERHAQRQEILRLQKEIALLQPRRVPLSQKYPSPASLDPAAPQPDPLAELRAARAADADRQLNAALDQAGADLTTPALPQA
jgi:hypothetical protein